MAKQPSKLRKQVEHAYTLTDQLKVQLQVLEDMRGGIRVQIKPMADADIEALAFLVLMQATKSAQDDLRDIMEKVKAINKHKQQLRNSLEKSKDRQMNGYDLEGTFLLMATLYTKQLEAEAIDIAKNDLDSMSEMGEVESLRLQMAMDRMSKMMSTLSNLLKKISDTSSQIVQNLK